ncbi:tRNA (adenosine(37)-N6)-threonylcarbamoyltransferase complex dimerization subunit type 1 TsaB [Agrilactobacillus fermenti]|uniref:tRNA (adenosine(37)-N6)-threonylcarbamoyltransferase complex dimerization subunit type 1 TsaB n=1 Tax=Agrilactobacillus fermenti TaxID=2586909 RepID=UPI001E2E78FC|nr:tRNA (adenosine(37)-N6)-threonylcarbamoyltransferase complex dimerization subunit type 1 TsaB [Agrilactobacillus fermenti]MCD2257503.1 tRNA (adenosine(37)-N6)-threonylcarbamoyltransferase complex dimerization subunit type 1 TsaB [Agrilactobacillus fermenti]
MNILAIDTSSKPLSVAITADDQILSEVTLNKGFTHSQTLMPTIDDLLKLSQLTIKDIDGFAVAKGPGSYTGLRIGVTTAKTFAWTLHKPLFALSSLEVLARNIQQRSQLIVPLMDARRNNVFAGVYQWTLTNDNHLENVVSDRHISLTRLLAEIKELNEKAVFVGEIKPFMSQIFAELGHQAEFAATTANLPAAANLGLAAIDATPIKDIYNFTPSYLRLTEAEVNWQRNHKDEGHDPYVQEV